MTKHTLGPWTVAKTITGSDEMITLRGESGSGEKIYDAMIESAHCFVAGVGGRGKENCLANARLIAAAPELLAACEAFSMARTNPELTEAVKLAETALRKAKGAQ